jgi:DNA repair photolyase
MRWQRQVLDAESVDSRLPLPLGPLGAVERTFDTPEFRGVTFFEVRAKSVLNRVPDSSPVPFRWTVNPYRGCSHACVYCFARKTHTYLDLDAGADFDTRIVVKVNAGEVLRRELATRTWRGERVALGTNVDPYQRAEGRYRVTRDVLQALVEARNPFSVLTKGTLLLRDLDLLTEGRRHAEVSVAVSVGHVDEWAWRHVEPGTPAPRRRLETVRRLVEPASARACSWPRCCPA